MDKIIQLAVKELGEKEVPGKKNNKRIVDYAKESGFEWVNDDETPWCSIFVNWVLKKAGIKGTGKANARSWLLFGINSDQNPEPGDIVVFWRGSIDSWKGHVGFFFGFSKDGSRVYCLGGNQGNQVSISGYSVEQVLGFRSIGANKKLSIPDPVLQKGDKGDQVKALQAALKSKGFHLGTIDGDFGPKTEKAVKALQSMKIGLSVDGVYGEKTRGFLFELMNE